MYDTIKEVCSLNGYINKIWKFFASIRLTVIVLLSLAATSVVGTIIPQNESPANYFRMYGESLYKLFSVLDIFDMYHSWWFQLLLLTLTVNIVVCSIDRLPGIWKIIFVRHPKVKASLFKNKPSQEFVLANSSAWIRTCYEAFISSKYGYYVTESIDPSADKPDAGFRIFAEKGRWTRIGVYIVHVSIILLLAGGLIGSIFGFEGYVRIPEGEATDTIWLKNTNQTYALNFEVRCDNFEVSFYDSGAPKEYRSKLTILENKKPVLTKDIIVNAPLRYKGINMFQSNYGMHAPKDISLSFTSTETGMVYPWKAKIGEEFEIPEGMGKFVVRDFHNGHNFMGHNIGEVFIAQWIPKDGDPEDVILPLRYPNFDRMRKGVFTASITDYTQQYYTGLQVTKDPGVMVVYAGFLVMIIGFFITFFMAHQQIYVEVVQTAKDCRIVVSGTANKNKIGMKAVIDRLSRELKRAGSV